MAKYTIEELQSMIVDVPDFPEKGIVFKDITPILLNPNAFESMIKAFADSVDFRVDKIAAIESRGFLLGAPLARHLDAGLVLIRKKGKLPRKTMQVSYGLEYGSDAIELQENDIQVGERVLIIDDVLATGGTSQACEKLCLQAGGRVLGFRFMMDLAFLNGQEKLQAPSQSLFSYSTPACKQSRTCLCFILV